MNWINWLITSSADPAKTAATVKGMLKLFAANALVIFMTICGFGLHCAGVDETSVNAVTDHIGNIVFWALNIWGTVQAIYGLYRKVKIGRWSAA